jgi:hypothetical protein
LRARLLLALSLVLTVLALTHLAWAWENGGADQPDPIYGTHDWIAERALDWLPPNEKVLILTYRAVYLYGTELPDNGIGDTTRHHVYFWPNGTVQDNASATRAMDMYNNALQAIASGNLTDAAKWTGAMTHYIDDLASFGHVMGAETSWGPEAHHSAYESYVERRTDSPGANEIPLSFDGTLASISPFQAAKMLAHDTTFDDSGAGRNATWMNQHYDWNDPTFKGRAYQSINLALNYVADAVHYVWSSGIVTTTTTQQPTTTATTSSSSHVVINEFEQNPPDEDRDNEWVELYNPTPSVVNISGWMINTTEGDRNSYPIPLGTQLLPGAFWVAPLPGLFIDNTGDMLILLNPQGAEIDRTPLKADPDSPGDTRTWQLTPDAGAD